MIGTNEDTGAPFVFGPTDDVGCMGCEIERLAARRVLANQDLLRRFQRRAGAVLVQLGDDLALGVQPLGHLGDPFIKKLGQDELHALIDTVPDSMVVINAAGTITAFSKGAEATFGYSENEVVNYESNDAFNIFALS